MFCMVTRARKKSNRWLKEICEDIKGKVLSIGSGNDNDGKGMRYKDYFINADSYTTSEVDEKGGCDLVLDVTNMKEIDDGESLS